MEIRRIYVRLLDEGSDVARPTQAEMLSDGVFKLLPTGDYDPEDEHWEFPPDSAVSCEMREHDGDKYLLAVRSLPLAFTHHPEMARTRSLS